MEHRRRTKGRDMDMAGGRAGARWRLLQTRRGASRIIEKAGRMPESFLGDGLIFEEALPVVWTPGPLAEGLALARLNADNHQLLGAESSLDEVRVHEALKDESPALVHELQRLEYKVNILLRLTAELALRNSGLPPAQRVAADLARPGMVRRADARRRAAPACWRCTSIRRCRSR